MTQSACTSTTDTVSRSGGQSFTDTMIQLKIQLIYSTKFFKKDMLKPLMNKILGWKIRKGLETRARNTQ